MPSMWEHNTSQYIFVRSGLIGSTCPARKTLTLTLTLILTLALAPTLISLIVYISLDRSLAPPHLTVMLAEDK